MGYLITVAGSIFSGLVAWLTTIIGRKLVVVGVTLSTFVFLTAAFLVCIKYLIMTVLALAVMPAWLAQGIGIFMPFNFVFILSNILSAHSCRWAYDKAMDKMRLINSAT